MRIRMAVIVLSLLAVAQFVSAAPPNPGDVANAVDRSLGDQIAILERGLCFQRIGIDPEIGGVEIGPP